MQRVLTRMHKIDVVLLLIVQHFNWNMGSHIGFTIGHFQVNPRGFDYMYCIYFHSLAQTKIDLYGEKSMYGHQENVSKYSSKCITESVLHPRDCVFRLNAQNEPKKEAAFK